MSQVTKYRSAGAFCGTTPSAGRCCHLAPAAALQVNLGGLLGGFLKITQIVASCAVVVMIVSFSM